MEKFFVIAHFGGKSYADGGIALVRDTSTSGGKEIVVVGPWSGPGPQYIVENWHQTAYAGIIKSGKRLDLADSIWDAVMRIRDIEKTDSVSERSDIIKNFESLVGTDLLVDMHLAGAF